MNETIVVDLTQTLSPLSTSTTVRNPPVIEVSLRTKAIPTGDAKVILHEFVDGEGGVSNDYVGVAKFGSLTSDPVWTIKKLYITGGGVTTTFEAKQVAWDDRHLEVYV